MAKVTLKASIDGDLLKRVKILAAESSSHQNVISLLDVSLGRLNDLEVKDHLGIDSDEDLFILMAHNHLPMPRLSSDKAQDMVESLNALSA